jgi:hypothetical protein
MERRVKTEMQPPMAGAGRLWLAAKEGRPTRRPQILPADRPELPMLVSFEGLSPEEQHKALSAFPGGRRFVLAS